MCILALFPWEKWRRDYSATWIAICVQLARAGTWRPRNSHKSRTGYLPWLMSCWLLRLNSRVLREHLTSQLSWVAARLLLIQAGKVEKVYEWSKVKRWERCVSGMRWQVGKGGRLVSREGGVECQDKIMLYYSREVKCRQGFTAGVW